MKETKYLLLQLRVSRTAKDPKQRRYLEIKCQLDATDRFFIAGLIAFSKCFGHHYTHHQELKSIVQAVAATGSNRLYSDTSANE